MLKRQNTFNSGQEKPSTPEEPILNKPRSFSQPPKFIEKSNFFEMKYWTSQGSQTPRVMPVVHDQSRYELIDTGRTNPIKIPSKPKKDDGDSGPSFSI